MDIRFRSSHIFFNWDSRSTTAPANTTRGSNNRNHITSRLAQIGEPSSADVRVDLHLPSDAKRRKIHDLEFEHVPPFLRRRDQKPADALAKPPMIKTPMPPQPRDLCRHSCLRLWSRLFRAGPGRGSGRCGQGRGTAGAQRLFPGAASIGRSCTAESGRCSRNIPTPIRPRAC